MDYHPLSAIKRQPVEAVLAGLKSTHRDDSVKAGLMLIEDARRYGLDMRDYLTLSIDTRAGENASRFSALTGYEAALAFLNLPIKQDLKQGVLLEAASDTFQTYPGTRAMFPEVVDDMLRWSDRQGGLSFEKTEDIVAVSRTTKQIEVLWTIVDDTEADRATNTIAELANIPVHTIRTSQKTVDFHKHGSGYRTSYEFSRRASLDLLTPFANRVQRQLQKSKMAAATSLLINGDGNYGAAPVKDSKDYATTVAGKLNYESLMRFLSERAKNGTPVDTMVGNYKAWIDWILMWTPTLNGNRSEAEALAAAGGPAIKAAATVAPACGFALSSTVSDDQLIGITKGETLEELVEAGSVISESEQAIKNQSITYVRTENTGYRLVFGDTRSIFDYSTASA